MSSADLTIAVEVIFKAVLAVLLPIVSVYALKLVAQAVTYFNNKTTADQRNLLTIIVRQAVLMAEQLGANAILKGIVYDKKQEALAYIKAAVARAGLSINVDDVEALLEAAVMSEFNKDVAIVQTPVTVNTAAKPASLVTGYKTA
jgi:Bacteriophage holin of superfamily 6 (Holin_LLH)